MSVNDGELPGSQAVVTKPGRRLTLLYILALSTVALLSVGAQWLIQWQLNTGESDSRVINVAGRQRMLSQRLAKAALRLNAHETPPPPQAIKELSDTLDAWSDSQIALQHGNIPTGLPGRPSAEVERLYAEIEPDFSAMREAASELVDQSNDSDPTRLIATILDHESAFLTGMDAIVTQYVAEAERRVVQLRRLEYLILASTLSVLLAEGLLIFRPAVKRIGQTVEHLASLSQRLHAAKELAERANTAKTRFLANVSHELRTPMTAVLGMTELAKETDDSEERNKYLSIVEEAGECLLGLLNDLIDTARIDADRLTLKRVPFDPLSPVSLAVRLMNRTAEESGATLRSIESENAPPRLLGDPERIVQVLLNLTSNAIKATPSGSVEIRCRWTPVADGNCRLIYEVVDTGVGIAESDQDRVFEAFTQIDSTDGSRRGGAGLGLAICRRIVDAMGGEIRLESELGHGATVRVAITLPVVLAEAVSPPTGDSRAPSRSLNLLVVEDTEVNQVLLQKSLQKAGHRVTLAADGESACRIYRDGAFDAVIIDLQLPGIDGAETANRMRQASLADGQGPPPMICLTAYAEPTIASSHALTFDAYLTKPIRREVLLATLDDFTFKATDFPRAATVDPDLLAELAEVFLDTSPGLLNELREAVDSADMKTIGVLTHKLLGQLPYFDAPELQGHVGELEAAASRGDSRIDELASKVWDSYDDLLSRLQSSVSTASR